MGSNVCSAKSEGNVRILPAYPIWLPSLEPFHTEHIVARQHGGPETVENLAWACHRCNAYKGPNLSAIDPASGQVVNLFHPRRDLWRWHFRAEGCFLRGNTPEGRATVTLLQMNSPRRLEKRAELIRGGWV